ncbi:hypothetical protein FBZ89_101346 [Nitrospirillum amazonense]|uniref:Uncharacterized protein n=1 Tax=Nitrospirillum amazonense TaxID=28077 RepID=A0A560FT81_9PROT|nr:hypothetical protein [Nitrospirillum amazonense]TWB24720.1 hypothetical protein FBZ89_101346 [Nitrospirillum amazonense]
MTIAIPAADRPALWPVLAMATVSAGLVMVDAALEWEPPFDALALLLVLALWCAAAMRAASLAVRARRQGQPRRAVSLALLPLAFLVTVVQPRLVMGGAQTLGDRLHFMIEYQEYLALIRATPDMGQPKLMLWGWGGFIVALTSLVYDESDEVTLPPERQSASWKARAEHTDLACPYGYWVRTALGAHFYAVGVGC